VARPQGSGSTTPGQLRTLSARLVVLSLVGAGTAVLTRRLAREHARAGAEDVPVSVTGTVRRFEVASVGRELGMTLDERRFAGRAGRPVLVAQSEAVAPGHPTP
jgi:hypothetical protein